MKRTDYCGLLTLEDTGRRACVAGWVQTKRDMGGVIFLDLRDREGVLQLVCDARHLTESDFILAEGMKNQSVITATGEIRLRDPETVNPKLKTGLIELKVDKIELLSTADPLPFSLEEGELAREDLRLKYRFLDLRRPRMLENLRYRHRVQRAVQNFLDEAGFILVETPMLTRSTPEGARDYLVPSRVHPGSFYALPQSPQIFKQLLMVGGIDKYYQVARCFRDEDLRADRQPEFTQVDMEMSFIDQEDMLNHLEKLFKHIFREVKGLEFEKPFPRMSWKTAMDVYGSDKPDLRFDLPIVDLTDLMAQCGFSVFQKAVRSGGVVRAINAKGCAQFSRTQIEELTSRAMELGAKGMAWIAIREDGSLYSVLTKYFTDEEMRALLRRMDAQAGDFILFCADSLSTVRRTLGGLRLALGDMLNLRRKDDYRFLIVTDFPQFEYSQEEHRYLAMHHPFTMPYPEDLPYLFTDPERVRAQAYDVVLNGVELGSGSIRIHRSDIQQKMFQALGFSEEQIQQRFGFMVNAFRYGTPPHGGFAFGLDRLVMLMLGAESLRDVIAFPKAGDASCPMTSAPSPVDEAQLKALNLDRGQSVSIQTPKADKEKKDPWDVGSIAHLARLSLTQEEKERMPREMEEIIAFAHQLSALDLGDVPPATHVANLRNVFREDQVEAPFERERILSGAPARAGSFISVPKVME